LSQCSLGVEFFPILSKAAQTAGAVSATLKRDSGEVRV